MKNHLLELLLQSKGGSDEATIEIYNKFLPLIRNFSKKSGYEEAETDLTIHLLEFIKKLNIDRLKSVDDGTLVNYISISMNNKYNSLLKNAIIHKIETICLDEQVIMNNDCYEGLDISDLYIQMKSLNKLQKKIIVGKYIYNYTDNELANMFRLSRQTIQVIKSKL